MWNLLSGYCSNLHSARPVAYPVVMMSNQNKENTMKTGAKFVAFIIGFIVVLALAFGALTSGAPDPVDPTKQHAINQRLLENCLRADRERIALYGEAQPTQDCFNREFAYEAYRLWYVQSN